jgi:hypothetical protein
LRADVSVYNVHITNQFQNTFAGGGGGGGGGGELKSLVEVNVKSKKEVLKTCVPNASKNSASGGWRQKMCQ